MSNLFTLIIIGILIAGVLSIVLNSLRYGISPMPSSAKAVGTIRRLLMNRRPEGMIVDLGSGWGTLTRALAAEFPHCPVTGIERSPVPFWFSLMSSRIMRLRNCRIIRKDFFEWPLKNADVIVCYLSTPLMSRLKLKLEREVSPGTLVISNTFAIAGWEPVETTTLDDLYRTRIYLYRI